MQQIEQILRLRTCMCTHTQARSQADTHTHLRTYDKHVTALTLVHKWHGSGLYENQLTPPHPRVLARSLPVPNGNTAMGGLAMSNSLLRSSNLDRTHPTYRYACTEPTLWTVTFYTQKSKNTQVRTSTVYAAEKGTSVTVVHGIKTLTCYVHLYVCIHVHC